jgi:hypothetical protein
MTPEISRCDHTKQTESAGFHNTCGLDLLSLEKKVHGSIASLDTADGVGVMFKVCNDRDDCVWGSAAHVAVGRLRGAYLDDGQTCSARAVTVLEVDRANDLAVLTVDGHLHPTEGSPGFAFAKHDGGLSNTDTAAVFATVPKIRTVNGQQNSSPDTNLAAFPVNITFLRPGAAFYLNNLLGQAHPL